MQIPGLEQLLALIAQFDVFGILTAILNCIFGVVAPA